MKIYRPSEEDILRKYKRSRKCARRLFGSQLGEDVAQEVALGVLEGKKVKQNDTYSCIDAARKPGSGAYYNRAGVVELSMPNRKTENTCIIDGIGEAPDNESTTGYLKNIFNFVQIISSLKRPKLIQIIILKDTYELTLFEISKLFRVSESSISQQYSLSKKLLKEISVKKGLSSCEQETRERKGPRLLSQKIKALRQLQENSSSSLAKVYNKEEGRVPVLSEQSFFKIPKAVFSFIPRNKDKDQKPFKRMDQKKLEGARFICPQMEKKTINFWT